MPKIELNQREARPTPSISRPARTRCTTCNFVGAARDQPGRAITTLHPTGALNAGERLDALMAPGGMQVCGNAQNCVAVCPKKIPLTTSIGRAGRDTTKRAFKKFFDR